MVSRCANGLKDQSHVISRAEPAVCGPPLRTSFRPNAPSRKKWPSPWYGAGPSVAPATEACELDEPQK